MNKEITLLIDGQSVTVPNGGTILDAANLIGIDIPTLCHNEALAPFTSCFLCVVEVEGRPNPVPSCSTRAADGMVVQTRSANIVSIRKMCLELLLSDHCGDCVAPCTITCPAGCNAEGFIRHIAEGREEDAIRVIKKNLPIPGALGRVCPRPCETKCRRVRVDDSLAIGWLHRRAADADFDIHRPDSGADTGKRVAVIGAGPAGMSAAYFLRQMGHAVTVLESEQKAGGMLAWGIPAYRLPRESLAKEIDAIIDMGVEMRFGMMLGRGFSIADLRKEGFDAVFLAVGAPLSSSLRTKGEELPGVMGGIELLDRVAHGEKISLGSKVVVVGGGNTAIDATRTARRLGAESVTVLYRRTRTEMPALPVEIEEAEREGVQLRFLASPMEIRSHDNGLVVLCQQMILGEPDESGRRRPVPVDGDIFELETDTVVAAIGQVIDSDMLKREGVALDSHKKIIAVNPVTLQTNAPDLFAGGDAVAKDDQKIAVWAVGSGRRAAVSIDQFLNGKQVTGLPEFFNSTMGEDPAYVAQSRFDGIEKACRAAMPEIEPEKRIDNFLEVERGFSPETAKAEAARCLRCGCIAVDECKLREYALEYGADPEKFKGVMRDYTLDDSDKTVILEQGKCIDCGICTRLGSDDGDEHIFGFVGRGFATRVQSYMEQTDASKSAQLACKCAEFCPTGAISERVKTPDDFSR